jgi:tetraacyldisaccharide 4'-kinase
MMRIWMRRELSACMLWPVSLLFRFLSSVRRAFYAAGMLERIRLPVPVIVVGNIFVGGTGKTPLTIWLVEALQRAGYVPGVISRGYGTAQHVPRPVMPDSTVQDVGDEPMLIAQRTQCPVMVGRNRVATGQALLAMHPVVNVILSDDGLQHYGLQRDVEIILFDARENGNGWLLPAGPLREPASRRRDFTVVNAAHWSSVMPVDAIGMQLVGEMAERLSDRSQRMALVSIRVRQIVAAAGIGNPARFFTMLRATGLVIDEMPLPDHHDFLDHPFAAVEADMILITEKDAVKCSRIEEIKNDARIWVVPVTARIDDAMLAEKIVEKWCGRQTA